MKLTGLDLTGNETVRARGRTAGGYANGSSGLVETAVVLTPTSDISVEQPAGTVLFDGPNTLDFGLAAAGSSSTKTVTIRSTGTAPLTDLAVTRTSDGTPADFAIGTLGATTVPRDMSTAFDITFSPAAAGVRNATLQIASNDPEESPFTLEFTYTRNKAALGELSFVREFSESLSGTWSTVGGAVETILGDDGALQTVRVSVPAGSSDPGFAAPSHARFNCHPAG
jgi:hypothetical protein